MKELFYDWPFTKYLNPATAEFSPDGRLIVDVDYVDITDDQDDDPGEEAYCVPI